MEQKTDFGLFPKAYGILANDRLMYPVDLRDWPLRIDGRSQLFLDDYLIADSSGLERQVHQPDPVPDNPLIVPDRPWEGKGIVLLQVLRENGLFRMWYTSQLKYRTEEGVDTRFPLLYAESEDGLTWRKPELGILEFEGSRKNNFLIHGARTAGLFHESGEPDPTRRYKALVWHEPDLVQREGYFLYTSPDGIRWNRQHNSPVVPSLRKSFELPQNGIGDTSIFRWDPVLEQYIGDVKFVLTPTPGRKMRCRGIMTSDDLVHWTRPRMTIHPDGLHWSRVGGREVFLPLGESDSWDPDYTDPVHSGPLAVGDEIWFYYRGSRIRERDGAPKGEWPGYAMAIGLAKLRKDGFVSLNAGKEKGTLLTRPLTFTGKKLYLNAEIGKAGRISAAVLRADGTETENHAISSCRPMTESELNCCMTWPQGVDLNEFRGRHNRLRFELENAKLYSFRIAD